jgi:hypothetical protein
MLMPEYVYGGATLYDSEQGAADVKNKKYS